MIQWQLPLLVLLQLKQIEVKKATVQANSKDELLDKIKNIEWNSIKPEDNKIGGRFDFSI